MSSIYDWSLAAAQNANADDIINWAEGQPPSTVNNSARAMMQRMREYIGDLGGMVESSGSASAISIISNSKPINYQNGLRVTFQALYDNTGKVTINVNSLGEKPVYKASYDGLTELEGAEIRAGAIYDVIYSTKLANNGAWFLPSPASPQMHSPGMISAFATRYAPKGWLPCDGRAVSRSEFSSLFSAIGVHWGAGDGSSTFNVPDLRGVFLRGWDNGRGIDSGRSFADLQWSENKSHSHSASCSNAGEHDHGFSTIDFNNPHAGPAGHFLWAWYNWVDRRTSAAGAHTHSISIDSSGIGESRPTNVSIFYAIKA